MRPYRLLVTGGRAYDDAAAVDRVLGRALAMVLKSPKHNWLVVVHGAGDGLDTLVDRWVAARSMEGQPVKAERHPAPCGREARAMRDESMVKRGADACVSFPGGRDAAGCTQRAFQAGIRVGTVNKKGELDWSRSRR